MFILGHDFPFGFADLPEEDRLGALKAAGFNAVMIHWQDADGKDACQRFDDMIRAGLQVLTVHFPQDRTADFWREGDAGDRLEEQLIRSLREAGERDVRHMVVHTTRRLETPPPNEIGARRFAHAAEAAEKYKIDLAVENTRFLAYNEYLYDRISSPRLRYCYDCGHAACFTPGQDPLMMFGDRMVTTHLHDNHGLKDEHLLIGEGTVPLDKVFLRLVSMGMEEYNLESRYRPEPGQHAWGLEEYLEKAYTRLTAFLDRAQKDFNALKGVKNNDLPY